LKENLMAYVRNQLISRAGYSGKPSPIGDVWDSITGAAGSVLHFWEQQQQAAGAAAQSQRDLQAAIAAQSGIGTGTILLIAGGGLAALLLLRKRS
jgi:hypothetical protein